MVFLLRHCSTEGNGFSFRMQNARSSSQFQQVGHMYAAEALQQMSQAPAALEHLQSALALLLDRPQPMEQVHTMPFIGNGISEHASEELLT